ncbi:MAG TPA: sigma 54-interacting transcriptional regulator [Polyangiaceae bacterium]
MTHEGTLPIQRGGLPVRQIRVEVTSGPDLGAVVQAEVDDLALTIGTAEGNTLVLHDNTVSRYHVEVGRRAGRILLRDLGSTNGVKIGSVFVRDAAVELTSGTELTLGATSLRVSDGQVVVLEHGPDSLGDMLGRAPVSRRLFATITRVARSDVSVLVLGESGTGKELVARAIHDGSARAEQPFVTVDCGALTPTLFASELFGHERGAFTGADRRHIGAFERAHRGTLFLDEIGELPRELQVALLGVLERGRLKRVGGGEEIPVDVRVVSATHRDLRAEVNAGSFRLDLFYRLAVVLLSVPPLRERRLDIPVLIEHFLRSAGHAGAVDEVFSKSALESLLAYAFPGNVRELRNIVLGRLALGDDSALAVSRATATNAPDQDAVARAITLSFREARQLVSDEFEKRYLQHLLERTGGNIRAASREANMNRSYLMELLRKHGFR